VLKIAIVGAESTGKSDLAQNLAKHFKTVWIEEYARKYLEHKTEKYTYDDILSIAQEQHQKAQEAIQNYQDKKYIFFDTELLVTKIWAEYVFGKCHSWILDTLPTQNYDFYLLTNIDLPWEEDPLREHPEPEKRTELHNLYKQNLIDLGFPFAEISGIGNERVEYAIDIIRNLTVNRKKA
jgi:NadR type nicotinamide-nucleotide adenylyltransferase